MADEINLSTGWTLQAYVAHNEAMRSKDDTFHTERDRRYTEVKQAEEKALKIKEEADRTALGLQRDNQQYRDEKGNELRAQIESERGTYATKTDLVAAVEKLEETIKPLIAYVSSQQGRQQGVGVSANVAAFMFTTLMGIIGLVLVVYFATT